MPTFGWCWRCSPPSSSVAPPGSWLTPIPRSASAGRRRCPGTTGSPAAPTRTGTMPGPGWRCGRRCSPPRSSGRCTLRSSPPPTTGSWCGGTSGDAAPPGCALTARCWACTRSARAAGPGPDVLFRPRRGQVLPRRRAGSTTPKPALQTTRGRPMSGNSVDGAQEGQLHPNVRLLGAFYQAHAAFYAGGDDTAALRGLLTDDIVWHVPGRSPIAGHYHGHQEVLDYFAARRAHAKAIFRVQPRAILADDERAVQLADGQLERDGRLRSWQTVGVFRIAGGKIAECWLVPFDQYLFDELWS